METNTVLTFDNLQNSGSPELDSHQKLLTLAKNGDQEAFSEIYNLFFDKIYSFIFYRVSHKEVAEDLTEDVFLKTFQRIDKLKEVGAFEGWLYQIARNTVIDYYRSKKIVVPLEQIENTVQYESAVIDILELEAQQKIFLDLLKELGPEQQTIIKLKFFDQLENTTIAAMLKKSEGSIRVIQHRALLKLKELLKRKNIS